MQKLLAAGSLALFSVLLSHSAAAQAGLAGHWQGVMVRDGAELVVFFDFSEAAPGYEGLFTAPSLRALGVPLRNIRYEPPWAQFELVGDFTRTVFEGELAGERIKGTFQEGEVGGTFSLERTPSPVLPYREEPARFDNGEVILSGTLLLPLGSGPHPAVVFLHGAGAEGRFGGRFLADHFARRGVAALIYDKRGVGASTGDWRRADFSDLAGDARAGVRFLLERPEIDPSRIGIFGHSQGGTIAPLIASLSQEVAFVISVASAAIPMHEVEVHSLTNQVRAQGYTETEVGEAEEFARLLVEVARTGDGWDRLEAAANRSRDRRWFSLLEPPSRESWFWSFYRQIADYNAAEHWEKVGVPVLVVEGDQDVFVPVEPSIRAIRQALEKARNKDYTVVVLPGAPHTFRLNPAPGEPFKWPRDVPGYTDLLTAWLLYRVR